jgi:hypothetical protein
LTTNPSIRISVRQSGRIAFHEQKNFAITGHGKEARHKDENVSIQAIAFMDATTAMLATTLPRVLDNLDISPNKDTETVNPSMCQPKN